MRNVVVLAMFYAGLSQAGYSDYQELRNLQLDAMGIDQLTIDSGAGSLEVKGVPGLDSISVEATISVENKSEDAALRILEQQLRLSLEMKDGKAILISNFEGGFLWRSPNARIDIVVSVPEGIDLSVDDGSGSIEISSTLANVSINDGSGSIHVDGAANVKIDDGSGSVDVVSATGDVSIVDGSGSISVSRVGGSVIIDDGSGSIQISDVERDLTIMDDGSGSFSFSNVRGNVEQET